MNLISRNKGAAEPAAPSQFHGSVRFIKTFVLGPSKIEAGKIFGKPYYTGAFVDRTLVYHILSEDGTVLDVAAHAIEQTEDPAV